MHLNAYPMFEGQCEAAFKFYETCLGGKILAMMPYAGSPGADQVPADWKDKIMHARMQVGEQLLTRPQPIMKPRRGSR